MSHFCSIQKAFISWVVWRGGPPYCSTWAGLGFGSIWIPVLSCSWAAENARGRDAKWFWGILSHLDLEEEGHEHNPWTQIRRTIMWLCLVGCHRPQVISVTPPAKKAFCHIGFVIARRRESSGRGCRGHWHPCCAAGGSYQREKVTAESHQVTWAQDTPSDYSLRARGPLRERADFSMHNSVP